MGNLVLLHGEADLVEIVATGVPPGGFPGRLDGRQEQADQDTDDRDHHQ